jgi:hypothetical protein
MSYNFRRGTVTMTDPAFAIKREVHRLVNLQIETLRQRSCLTTSDLFVSRTLRKNYNVVSRARPDAKSELREAIAQSILRVHRVRS